jgi:hypothetical protein
MKTSKQTQWKGTSRSHPYSPSKNTTKTHTTTGASSPPRTTSKAKYEKRTAGPKLFPYPFRFPFITSRAFLTTSPAKKILTSKFSYLLFFFPIPPLKTKTSYNSIYLAKLDIFHINFLWKTRNSEPGTRLGCPNFEILWLPRKSQPGTEKSNPPISSKWWYIMVGFLHHWN